MILKLNLIIIIMLILITLTACEKQQLSCNSISTPEVKVVCKPAGVYQEFNIDTGKNEYKSRQLCYAYPSGDKKILYRGIGYQNDGSEQSLGEIYSGGSIEIGTYRWLSFVKVFPNLNGIFCKDKTVIVYKEDFIIE